MTFFNNLLTERLLQLEAIRLAYYKVCLIDELSDIDFKLKLNYDVITDNTLLTIKYKDKEIKHKVTYINLKMSIDDFDEYILFPKLIELQDKFNEYDDAGQII